MKKLIIFLIINRTIKLSFILFLKTIIIIMVTFLLSCRSLPFNPIERNKIKFNISSIEIEDSLNNFESLINKLALTKNNYYEYKLVDTNTINLYNCTIDTNIIIRYPFFNKVSEINKFSKEDGERLFKLILFLNNNYLSSCYFCTKDNLYIFRYKAFKKKITNDSKFQYDLDRYIYFSSKGSYNKILFKELDNYGKMHLLTHIDSQVW